jgi:putative phage-type endonuclease
MRKIALEQGSDPWKQWRRTKVTAADAAPILNISPYLTQFQLFQIKMGLHEPVVTASMKQGTENEGNARLLFAEMTGIMMFPAVVVHDQIDYMAASLDGMNYAGTQILEIKCNGAMNHAKVKAGEIPDHHMAQLQHQMEVCGLPMAYYFSFHNGEGVIKEVEYQQDFVSAMLPLQEEFYLMMQSKVYTKELTDRDYIEKKDNYWLSLTDGYRSYSRQIKEMEEKQKSIREKLISESNGQSSIGGGIRVIKSMRKGLVDYRKIDVLKGIDLEKYRKPASEVWTINEIS